MSMKKVTLQLYKQAEAAAKDLSRFDRVERYVLLQVITAAEHKQPLDGVFITCAKKILENQSISNASVAA